MCWSQAGSPFGSCLVTSLGSSQERRFLAHPLTLVRTSDKIGSLHGRRKMNEVEGQEQPLMLREVIGSNIRALRVQRGMRQDELGKRLEELLGKPWSNSMVSKLERGMRDWRLEELMAIGRALRYPLTQFLRLTDKGDPVGHDRLVRLGDDDNPRYVTATEARDFFFGDLSRLAVAVLENETATSSWDELEAIGGERRLTAAMRGEVEPGDTSVHEAPRPRRKRAGAITGTRTGKGKR